VFQVEGLGFGVQILEIPKFDHGRGVEHALRPRRWSRRRLEGFSAGVPHSSENAPSRTLHTAYAWGPMMVLGEGAWHHERGTPHGGPGGRLYIYD
jgi:hypothetical protein